MIIRARSVLLAPNTCCTIEEVKAKLDSYIFSEKLNGIRMLATPAGILGRSGLPLKNRQLVPYFADVVERCQKHRIIIDGEFYSSTHTWSDHLTAVNSLNAPVPKQFQLYAFDCMSVDAWNGDALEPRYSDRLQVLETYGYDLLNLKVHNHTSGNDWSVVQNQFDSVIGRGGEGLIVRGPHARYKFGRATPNERIIYKLKNFQFYNGTVLSSAALVRQGRAREALGTVEIKLDDGRIVNVGSGFTTREREQLWKARLTGRRCRVRGTEVGGVNTILQPSFQGWLDEESK